MRRGLRAFSGVIALTSVLSCGGPRGQISPLTASPASPTTAPAVTESAGRTATYLQLDPAVRDVRLRVDGALVVSDADGRVVLPQQGTDEVEVVYVGYSAAPAIRRVRFAQWADGSVERVRALRTDRSVPRLEIEVLHRVVVVDEGAAAGTAVRFDSPAGTATLPVGAPTWVPAQRAGMTDLLSYTTPADPSRPFVPTPEAQWNLAPSGG